MKKYLYILLSLLGVLTIGCSKDDDVLGDEPPAVNKEWIMIDDVVMASKSQVFDIYFETTGNTHPAAIEFHAQLFKGSRYLLNNFRKFRFVDLSGGYSSETIAYTAWDGSDGAMRFDKFFIQPEEMGCDTLDFYVEYEEVENPTPRPYAFRSRVYRLVVSKIEGGWNIDSFGLAPGQEDSPTE